MVSIQFTALQHYRLRIYYGQNQVRMLSVCLLYSKQEAAPLYQIFTAHICLLRISILEYPYEYSKQYQNFTASYAVQSTMDAYIQKTYLLTFKNIVNQERTRNRAEGGRYHFQRQQRTKQNFWEGGLFSSKVPLIKLSQQNHVFVVLRILTQSCLFCLLLTYTQKKSKTRHELAFNKICSCLQPQCEFCHSQRAHDELTINSLGVKYE
eukprot:TRINITY_DN4797_c0_g1_i5.p4 TRINITY_DN4797_c0_g1~~TRINITY_DN4797_c0_g1_i5.p4  ORF type:complete len:208 (+),score=-3.50 TRINITY_DN4797_c0_g1_i5:244-867(+)